METIARKIVFGLLHNNK